MPTKYYLAFASSKDLEGAAIELLERHANGAKDSHIPLMESTMDYFIPEMLSAFLVDTVDALGLSKMATKIIHSTADIIGKTAKMLVPQLLKKRSNEELTPMIEFVDEIYVRDHQSSNGKACTGCEMDEATFTRMKNVVAAVRAGQIEENRGELTALMSMTVDILLEGLMKEAINKLKHGFVVRKIADGAISTCQAAGHGVVNKVFKKLDDEQMLHLANYFDTLLVSAER